MSCEVGPGPFVLGRDDLHEPQEAIRGRRPNAFVTPSDLAAEGGERAAMGGIIPVVDGKVPRRGRFESALRRFSRGGACEPVDHRPHGGIAGLCDELVLGFEVPVEPTVSEAGRRHQVGETGVVYAIAAKLDGGGADNTLPGFCRLVLRLSHGDCNRSALGDSYAAGSDPLRNCTADCRAGILLNEMHSGHRDLGLVLPATAEFTHGPIKIAPGSALTNSLGNSLSGSHSL